METIENFSSEISSGFFSFGGLVINNDMYEPICSSWNLLLAHFFNLRFHIRNNICRIEPVPFSRCNSPYIRLYEHGSWFLINSYKTVI